MTYKKIIVAVDGSDTAVKALQEAIEVATAFHAELRIVNVTDEYLGYIEGLSVDLDDYTKSIKQYGLSLLNTMQEVAQKAGVTVSTRLIEVTDTPARVPELIIDEAQKYGADLLVLGTHGRRGFSRLILGSVADAVIRLSHLPVLLVRSNDNSL